MRCLRNLSAWASLEDPACSQSDGPRFPALRTSPANHPLNKRMVVDGKDPFIAMTRRDLAGARYGKGG